MDQVSRTDTIKTLIDTIIVHKLAINGLTSKRLACKYQAQASKLYAHLDAQGQRHSVLRERLEALVTLSEQADSAARSINLDSTSDMVERVCNTRRLLFGELYKLLDAPVVQEYGWFVGDEARDLGQLVALSKVVSAWVDTAYLHVANDNFDRAEATALRVLQRLQAIRQELER